MGLPFKLITTSDLVVSDEVESITVPGTEGHLTILPQHTHILFDINPGAMHYIKKDKDGNLERIEYQISLGLAEMSRDGKFTIFTEEAKLQQEQKI